MAQSNQTILVSIRHAGAEMPCVICPSAGTTLASVRSIALDSFGIPHDSAERYKLFVDAVELVDLTETVGRLAAGERLVRLDLGIVPDVSPRNPRFELTQDQFNKIMHIEAEATELRRQLKRTGVHVNIAQLVGELDGSSTATRTSGGVVEECYLFDEIKGAAAMQALQQLADGAGNEAFLAAYESCLNGRKQ
jgi:hypothetical protein